MHSTPSKYALFSHLHEGPRYPVPEAIGVALRQSFLHGAVIAAMACFAPAFMMPSEALAELKVGIETLYLSGTHDETHASVHEQLIAPVIHLNAGGRRVQFTSEGIPLIGTARSGNFPNAPSTTNLGFVNANVIVAVDPKSRVWLGAGGVVINQQTQLAPSGDIFEYLTESSRVFGVSYEAQLRLPAGANTVVLDARAVPNLYGTVFLSNCGLCFFKEVSAAERGGLSDLSALFEISHRRSTWDFGLRAINYSAVFTQQRSLADRNVGGGITIRYYYTIGR